MSPDDHSYAPVRVGRSHEEGIKTVPSVCPHDCTSTCALEVERLSPTKIGRVRGSQRNDYTAGVICEKVARYAERIHHPDRLMKPMRRTGPKGSRQFAEISWSDALDIVAEQFIAKVRQTFERFAMMGETPVLLTSPMIRPFVRSIVERFRPSTTVMSQNEIYSKARIKTVGSI